MWNGNQRQVFVEEYVRSGDHLEAAKKAGHKDTHKYLSLTRLSIIMEPSTDTSKSGHVILRIMFCMRKADLFEL